MSATTQSFCVICDARAGDCDHDCPRYLEPVVYERVIDAQGKQTGWKVPESEREDWERRKEALFEFPGLDQGKRRDSKDETKAKGQARPLQHLVVELEGWLDLDRDLEQRFRALYERSPMKAARLQERVINETRSGKLDNPASFFAWRLRDIEKGLA